MEEIRKYQVSEIKVSYLPKTTLRDKPMIQSSEEAFQYILEGFDRDTLALQEQFVVMYLNRANKVLGLYRASKGGITGTVADPRLILAIALKIAAVGIIVAHNHPSGSLKPSLEDEKLTCKIKEAARFMDIKLLDHLIIGPSGRYISFAEGGLMIN